ncbi:MAG: MFS transporter [Nitrospinaceae bacterium]|nr:MFS transporter [Nitrospinaceae bacterium]
MGLWFSASAIIPALRLEYQLSDQQVSLISSSVSAGFVVGTLTSAVFGLADRLDPRRFFMASAVIAAISNVSILWADPASLAVPALRFIVGACMAGVYPVGMKMSSTWARGDTGLLVGLLVGALTLGSASPYLLDALGGLDWRFTLVASSALAAASGALILLMQLGPNLTRSAKFRAPLVLEAWRKKSLRLANLGYFGHMFELYAMWTWIGVFLTASFALNPGGEGAGFYAKLLTFAVIAAGGAGSLFGGLFADRLGRTTLTMGAMGLSGACAIASGFLFGGSPWLLGLLCLIWGVAVVADSAQFSASIIELSDPSLVGTMVTVQTCAGFLLTMFTIHMIPPLTEVFGWRYAFAFLAIGPFLGVWAMSRLRRHPEAAKLASGNR